jgi:hypothetical protein
MFIGAANYSLQPPVRFVSRSLAQTLGQHVCSRAVEPGRESSGKTMSKERVICLRCSEVELIPFARPSADIDVFDCPACHRRYTRKPGRALTYPWLSPVSLPLYCVLFDSDPMSRVSQLADLFIRQKSPDDLRRIVGEIQEELDRPTQQVRDILDNAQSEEQCREYLRQFAADVRGKLGAA